MKKTKIVKKYILKMTEDETGKRVIEGTNEGFTAFELLGMFEFKKADILNIIKDMQNIQRKDKQTKKQAKVEHRIGNLVFKLK